MNLEISKLRKSKVNEIQTISSTEVAVMVNRYHKNVMQDLRKLRENISQLNFELSDYMLESTYINERNKDYPCYLLTKKGCELYATRMTGIEGTAFAIRYIEKFNEMESELKQKLPGSYAEALLELAHTVQKNEELENKIALDEPKVVLAESIENSNSLILIRDLAKIIKQNGYDIGEKRLFKWLRENGFLTKNVFGYTTPTQKAMNLGVFRVVETTKVTDKGVRLQVTTKVTMKGQTYFVNKFKNLLD